jgi:hypothetical protein
MGECLYCIHDHALADPYAFPGPLGCPFFGSPKAWDPGRPKAPRAEDVIALAERQREREREVWKIQKAAAEKAEWGYREREYAKIKAWLGVIKAEARAEVATQNEADMAKVHEIVDGQRAAEAHERRTRIRQMIERLGR